MTNDTVRQIADRLHREHGCNGNPHCMFPLDYQTWCTRPEAHYLATGERL